MQLNPLIFPGEEIDRFVIKEEVLHQRKRSSIHSNVLIISKKNILYQCEHYIGSTEEAKIHNKNTWM